MSQTDPRRARLDAIVRPLPDDAWRTQTAAKRLTRMLDEEWPADYGRVDRVPDFQRGHVWTPEQQRAFIEGLLRGTVGDNLRTITFNCPQFQVRGVWLGSPEGARDLPDGVVCVDGLQRLTAIERWVRDEVHPFGLSHADVRGSQYDPLHGAMAFPIHIAVFAFQTRAALLDYYLAVNEGGTVHSATELARVRALRASLPADTR